MGLFVIAKFFRTSSSNVLITVLGTDSLHDIFEKYSDDEVAEKIYQYVRKQMEIAPIMNTETKM